MSEKQKSPKLEFQTNVPVTLTPKKLLKEGDGEYGPWYMWAVSVEGQGDHVCFLKPKPHDLFAMHQGQRITVVNAEVKGEDGKKYTVLRVVGTPAAPQAPKPSGGYQDKGEGQIATPRGSGGVQDASADPKGLSIEVQVVAKVAGEIVAANPDKDFTDTANEIWGWMNSVLRPEKTHKVPVEEDNIPYTEPEEPPPF